MQRAAVAVIVSAAISIVACSGTDSLVDVPQPPTTMASVAPANPAPSSATTVATGSASTDSPSTNSPTTDSPTTAEPASIRFTPQTFVDPAANGVTAVSVLVPTGWQASGSVQWLPLWSRLAFLQTRVADPVSGITVDWLPIQDFIYFTAPAGFDVPIGGNYQGKAYVPPIIDPVEFVRQFWVPNDLAELAGAQLVSGVEVPAIAQDFLTQFGGPGEAHAYRLRYSYMRDGQAWERDVSFALLFTSNGDITSWYVNYAHTASAPQGELDRNAGIISTIIASRISTPEWEANYRLVGQLFRQGLQQQMADTVAFGELLAQYRAESARLQQQVVNERQASQDRQAQFVRETLGGVDTYVDPINNTLVQLPSTWDTYWVNSQGDYLAVDDPGFDPNTLNDGSWTQLDVNDG